MCFIVISSSGRNNLKELNNKLINGSERFHNDNVVISKDLALVILVRIQILVGEKFGIVNAKNKVKERDINKKTSFPH